MSIDLTQIDLLSLIGSKLKRVSGTRGGEFAGVCPMCGGRDRMRVQPYASPRPIWWCRQCSPTEHWQDAIAFVRQRDSVSFREACTRLQLPLPTQHISLSPLPSAPPEPVEPPTAVWQAAAAQFVVESMATLHRTDRAKAYLQQRGLQSNTWITAGFGYNPSDRSVPRALFGLPPQYDACGAEKQLWLPRGFVIPSIVDKQIWRVTIRRFHGDPKYYHLPGSSNAPFGIDTIVVGKPVVIVEGFFDGLALWQEAGDLVATVATGATGGRRAHWIAKLALASSHLISHDADAAGDEAALYWNRVFTTTARRWRPVLKDPSEMLSQGHSLREWVTAGLPSNQHQLSVPALASPPISQSRSFSVDAVRYEATGTEAWRVWDDVINVIIAEFPTEAEAEADAIARSTDAHVAPTLSSR